MQQGLVGNFARAYVISMNHDVGRFTAVLLLAKAGL